MSDHTHSQYVAGCPRCDLGRDEVTSGYITEEMVEKVAEAMYVAEHPAVGGDWGREGDAYRALYVDSARAALSAVLPGVIQQAKAEAWDEGHAAGCADPYAKYGECGCGPNPYRADLIEQGVQP